MCIFTGQSRTAVARTRIFARPAATHQWLAYAMHVDAPRELAMILPLPVPSGSADDAANFLDLSAYPGLFDDLDRCFPRIQARAPAPAASSRPEAAARLTVHSVGAFEASYVPQQSDFARLDPRFRLPDELWQRLPTYADWGFAIVQLKPGRQDVHPIVVHFPRRWPDRLYFPTVHVHDATLHPTASYDHHLYYQGMPGARRRGADSERSVHEASPGDARAHVKLPLARGVIEADHKVERVRLHGTRPNEDVWLTPAG